MVKWGILSGRATIIMEEEELLKKRLRELAQKSYRNTQYTFTGFFESGGYGVLL